MLDRIPILLKDFPIEDDEDINKCDFLILYNEMCQHLKEPYDSVNQYFLNNQCTIIQNHSLVTDPFKVQARPMDFNIKEYEEFIYMASGSTLQLTFKKLPLAKF